MVSLLCPTRNRPSQLREFIGSVCFTVTRQIEIIVYVDEDDHSYEGKYFDILRHRASVEIIKGPRITLSDCWNKCAEKASGDILAMNNDDCLYKTTGWDVMIEEAFNQCPDRILMVHGSPTDKPEYCGFAAHPVIHRRWLETVGYFTWPHFTGDYADTFIDWIARELGRAKCLPYALEHIHPYFGKGHDDQTYRDRATFHAKDNPTALWDESLPDRLAAVEKLRAVMR